jgi:RNA polymerase sigma-70 factor (ECF subfamily)
MELRPDPEVIGLLWMLLQESRHAARTSPTGELILLETRTLALEPRADRGGSGIAGGALKSRRFGSTHCRLRLRPFMREAESVAVTDWRQIVALYDRLVRITLRQLHSSIVQPLPCAMVQRPVWRISTRC